MIRDLPLAAPAVRRAAAAAVLALVACDGRDNGLGPPDPPGPGDPITLELVWERQSAFQTFTALHDRRGRPYLYVVNRAGGLLVYDVANAQSPQLVRTVPGAAFNGRFTNNLYQVGDDLYVAIGNFMGSPGQRPGLAIVDVSDPANAAVTDVWEHSTGSRGAHVVEVRGGYAYLGASFEGLIILDVMDRRNIRFVSQLVPDPHYPRPNPPALQMPAARGLTLASDDLLVLCNDAGGIRMIDVRDKAAPVEVGRYINPAIDPQVQAQAYNNVVVDGQVAYVAVDYCGVEILDISDPASPRLLGWWNPWDCVGDPLNWFTSPGHASELVLKSAQRRLFVSAGDTELAVLDVSDPASPTPLATWGEKGNNRVAWGLDVTATHVFLAHIVSPGGPFVSNWAGVAALSYR